MKQNLVFIAQSLDGYIADRNGGLGWLEMVPNPEKLDMGYMSTIERIDALVMGRNTFDTVCSFGIDWPYTKPVFVISNSMSEVPGKYKGKIELVKGSLSEILESIHAKGYESLYIDGGKTIQSFLKEDLIDELIVTTIPILLGEGASLFGNLPKEQEYELVESKVYLDQIVQSAYKRKR
ncbi:dihydrofolate reductase family protein [Marinifilum flexuosum]|uniref:dihydrofolate reductase family protein n=1 Tax=Marinifilum flexuosum TaxID=1117708 RepID=UPI0024958DA9|nr:dihydrofolate reductase family protein [Marinifilum flexuosum]